MKINTQPGFTSSFGIPPQMKAAEEKFREERTKPSDESASEADFDFSPSDTDPPAETPVRTSQPSDPSTPEEALKQIGIELDDEDFQKLFFRGFIEKEVKLFSGRGGQKDFTVTFKTLTGQEYDEVDELLADDIQATKMTNDGYATRRNMWTLAFAVSHLAGKPVCKPVMKTTASGEVVDLKETAKKRRDVLCRLSGGVISKMMRTFGIFSVSVNDLIETPESDHLKKP